MSLRAPLPPFLVVGTLAVIALMGGFHHSTARQRGTTESLGHELRGAHSCAASSCHGGDLSKGENHSSYTRWIQSDPHAGAFHSLVSPLGRRIVQSLLLASGQENASNPEEKAYRQLLEQRCTSCHTTSGVLDEFARDGVGCEACHGPSSNWIEAHVSARWKNLDALTKRTTGMTGLSDLQARVQVCVPCHVGAPTSQGDPTQDVDHELIAAGHPRLAFEFGAYLHNLPSHWDRERDRRDALPRGFEAEAWILGQITSAVSFLRMSNFHAGRESRPWPDYSQLDCYACHHDVGSPGSDHRHGRTQGTASWGSWHLPLTSSLLRRGGFEVIADQLESRRSSNQLLDEGSLQELERSASSLRELATHPTELLAWLISLSPTLASWDDYAQWYGALAALNQARVDLQGMITESDERFGEELEALHRLLRFPKRDEATLRSPHGFDPNSDAISTSIERLAKILGEM